MRQTLKHRHEALAAEIIQNARRKARDKHERRAMRRALRAIKRMGGPR